MTSLKSAQIEMHFLSDPSRLAAVRHEVESLCARQGCSQQFREEIGLCVNEALANVIRHAYNGQTDRPIDLRVQVGGGEIRVIIRDWGNGQLPAANQPHTLDPLRPGGLGLICLRKMMNSVTFTPQPDGMILEMTRHT